MTPMPSLRPIALACLLTAGCLPTFALHAAAPPTDDLAATRRDATVDTSFGLSMPDPYRWMEGESNAAFNTWLDAQGARTRTRLDALPTLPAWRTRLNAVAGAVRNHGGHELVGDRLFFRRIEDGKEAKLLWRDGNGPEHVLFDPATQPGGATIANFSVSPDGKLATITVSRGGNEISAVELYEVETGKRRDADALPPVWSEFNPSWLGDGSGFAYTRMAPDAAKAADPMQGMVSAVHRIGQPHASDTVIAIADGSQPLDMTPESFPITVITPGSDWAQLLIVGARASGRACVAPAADVVAGKAAWRCLVDFDDNISSTVVHGDTLYMLQTGATPYGRILAIDLEDPAARLADARVVMPERRDVVVTGMVAAADGLYVKTMRDGIDHLERVDHASGVATAVPLPLKGTATYLSGSADAPGVIVSQEDWTTPRTFYRIDGKGGGPVDMRLGNSSPADYSSVMAEQTEAVSADGTRVPLSVLSPRGMARDGHALAIVEGYGGYGSTTQPHFFPMFLEWAKAGHVYAYCHVRGGGEKGDAWRVDGSGANKQRGIEDFIACAKTLAAKGYTQPARTAGVGTSMGGILAGGAYVTEPTAFGAMAINVGVLNPVRLLAAKNGANQIPELGDPRTAEGMRQLLAMDPYQRVRDGVRYPPLLVNVGLSDQRVAPWNGGKFAAQVAHASPDTPVWIRTDAGVGHFATSYSGIAIQFADFFAWMEHVLGGDAVAGKAGSAAVDL